MRPHVSADSSAPNAQAGEKEEELQPTNMKANDFSKNKFLGRGETAAKP